MNSALAELLHLLTSAALQPSIHPLSIAGAACGYKSCRDVLRWSGRVLSSRNLRRSHVAVFVFKQKTARPESDQARRLNKNDVVLCILCDSVSRISVITARCELQKFIALFKTRIFKFVKYTKTLSVRNQHDRDSRAFFTFNARQLTHAHRFKLLTCVAARASRALNRVREVPRASRRKIRTSK